MCVVHIQARSVTVSLKVTYSVTHIVVEISKIAWWTVSFSGGRTYSESDGISEGIRKVKKMDHQILRENLNYIIKAPGVDICV